MLDNTDPGHESFPEVDHFHEDDKENSPIAQEPPGAKYASPHEHVPITPEDVKPQDSASVKLKTNNKISEELEELKLATIESPIDSDNILSLQCTSKSKPLDADAYREPVFNSDVELQLNPDFSQDSAPASKPRQSPEQRRIFAKRRREEYIGLDNVQAL